MNGLIMSGAWIRGGVAALVLIATSAAAQKSPPVELNEFSAPLSSDNSQDRFSGREGLTRSIGQAAAPRRTDLVAELVEGFADQPWRVRLGIVIALAKQPTPWTARDHKKQVAMLYGELLTHADETLGPAIDDALANASGYYRDAIIDYNNDRIDDIDAVVAKFRATAVELPKSKYAPSASFYLAQYLTRAYLLGHARGRDLVSQAIAERQSFIAANEASGTSLLNDAYFYLALDQMLLDDTAGAIATLSSMEAKFSDKDRVYVYQFLFAKSKSTVVDRSFASARLARKTRKYIQQFGAFAADDQGRYIEFVKNGE